LTATGLRFGTPRKTDGRTGGQADGVMGQMQRWAAQLEVPALRLATGKISADRLDPAQLSTPRAAAALAARADSARRAWDARLGRRYMPPGLLPRATPGPKRARRAGTTVRFPRAHEEPAFLLRTAELSIQLAEAGATLRTYAASVSGVTSDPALYGRPATASAAAPDFRLGALLDHVRPTPRDTAAASLAGVALPPLALPSLPIRLDPGMGTVALSFSVQGDQVRARWTVQSDRVRWSRDPGGAASPSPIGDLVWRAGSGIAALEV